MQRLHLDEPRDVRGSNPGEFHSFDVGVASSGANVYVYAVCSDLRNGASDVLLRRSTDGGATWDLGHDQLDASARAATRALIAPVMGGGLVVGAVVVWIDFRSGAGVNGHPYARRIGR